MQAIEFEATPFQHTIRVPNYIPDGVSLRVLLLVEDKIINDSEAGKRWKNLLGSMPDVASDEDFARQLDYGREQTWNV